MLQLVKRALLENTGDQFLEVSRVGLCMRVPAHESKRAILLSKGSCPGSVSFFSLLSRSVSLAIAVCLDHRFKLLSVRMLVFVNGLVSF